MDKSAHKKYQDGISSTNEKSVGANKLHFSIIKKFQNYSGWEGENH